MSRCSVTVMVWPLGRGPGSEPRLEQENTCAHLTRGDPMEVTLRRTQGPVRSAAAVGCHPRATGHLLPEAPSVSWALSPAGGRRPVCVRVNPSTWGWRVVQGPDGGEDASVRRGLASHLVRPSASAALVLRAGWSCRGRPVPGGGLWGQFNYWRTCYTFGNLENSEV